MTFDPNNGPPLPLQTTAEAQTEEVERRHAELHPEQGKREPLVNSIEHGATTFLADIEKIAARTLVDVNGYPVMRRLYADNADGIPADLMAPLLRNYGQTTKSHTVFSGNHGQGLILANGTANPAGLAIISKTADFDEPYMAYWWKHPVDDQYALRTFWIPEDEEAEDADERGEWAPIIGLMTFDGIDWNAVWTEAYNNPRFKGTPDSGTVIVEMGESRDLTDSTYLTSQQTRNEQTSEWLYSRWAVGQYYNSKFWQLPLDVYWGVPGTTPGSKPRLRKPPVDGRPRWATTSAFLSKWEYRAATGLRAQMEVATPAKLSDVDEDDEVLTSVIHEACGKDAVHLIESAIPVTVEVYVRELPPGVEARKLNFQVRRRGKIALDYDDELFEWNDNPHASFGMTRRQASENVWLRIIPDHKGVNAPGNVWMAGGRKNIQGTDSYGTNIDLPWRDWGAEFRTKMPKILVDFLKSLESDTNIHDLSDRQYRAWWEKVAGDLEVHPGGVGKTKATKLVTKNAPHRGDRKGQPIEDSDGRPEPTGRTRGPNVNHGTHPAGGRNGPRTRRRVPGKGPHTHPASVPGPDHAAKPKPPHIKWIEDEDEWVTDAKWGVVWEEPSNANDGLGKVFLNWNHWLPQQYHKELLIEIRDSTSPYPLKAIQQVLARSAVTKIGHRRNECANRTIGITPEERVIIFHPASLTGYIMGRADHWSLIMSTLSGLTGGAKGRDGLDDEAPDEAAG